ncbi:MAG: hypothetical protein FJ145_01895 [Deltaproteobacteria bacterium]|nr:hypothetical protein [Deltaproteobacteria bacterium]
MKRTHLFGLLAVLFGVAGCASFQAAGEAQRGRPQLIFGDPKVALAHFQRASELDSGYVKRFRAFDEGVWTYVGRANYAAGRLPEARQALDRAISMNRNDNLARLYLGLVLTKGEDRTAGLREIEGGMKGIYNDLEYITANTHYGQFWDPRREIRSEIETNLRLISGKDADLKRIVENGEWVGRSLEEEADRAQRDEREDQTRDGDNGRR